MGKQHLDALSVATGLFEGLCAGERTSYIAGIFMNAARDLAGRLLRAASHFVRARVAIRFARPIQHLIIIHDPAGRSQDFECWTDVDVARLVEVKSSREKVPSSRLERSQTGMCGSICFVLTIQSSVAAEP
jgi:hypothetical protein